MTDIASKYNMPLRDLYFKNRLAYGMQPAAGTILKIEKYVHFGKKAATESATTSSSNDRFIFTEISSL